MPDSALDLIVVGGGTAGLVGAHAAAQIGARVALVERGRTGGDCLWTGCVPSKALLAVADTLHSVRRSAPYLVEDVSAHAVVDVQAVMRHVRSAIRTIEPVDSPEALREVGVQVVHGEAQFVSDHSVVVAGRTMAFHRALLATGAAPRLPDIPGLVESAPWTTETLWDAMDELDRVPERIVVIGGGPVGCEMSQAFARLGSSVTLVEVADRVLPREDPEAAAIVVDALRSDGVDVRLRTRVAAVSAADDRAWRVALDDGHAPDSVPAQHILVATGRSPRTRGLSLDVAGVRLTPSGAVAVDSHLRTSNPRVFAAGDVTPFPHLTHLAAYHAGIAAVNALLGLRRRVDLRAVPRVTYTDPEVAAVGAPTWSDDPAYAPRTVTRRHDHVDRAIAEGRIEGFSRLTLDRRGRVVTGATLVGPRAGESIAELGLAVRRRTPLTTLAATVHAYPTYADGPWNAAVDEVRRRLGAPAAQAAGRVAVAMRRSWPRR